MTADLIAHIQEHAPRKDLKIALETPQGTIWLFTHFEPKRELHYPDARPKADAALHVIEHITRELSRLSNIRGDASSTKTVITARSAALIVAERRGFSQERIARHFGMNHTAVVAAKRRLKTDQKIAALVELLENRLDDKIKTPLQLKAI